MKEKYPVGLTCKYWKDKHIILFPHEYVIKFKSSPGQTSPIPLVGKFKDIKEDEDWCIINKSDLVKKIDDKKGIVRTLIYSIIEEKALIGIQDSADHRISRFFVPKSELIFDISKEGNHLK